MILLVNVLELVPCSWIRVLILNYLMFWFAHGWYFHFGCWFSIPTDYLLEWMLIDIISLFEHSSKKPRIDSRARWKNLVGNLVIKTIENLIALLLLGSYADWHFKRLYGSDYLNILILKISELMNVVWCCMLTWWDMPGTLSVGAGR